MKVPDEPKEIKRKIQMFASEFKDHIKSESLAVWMFNLLPKYLWDSWKLELKAQGLSWKEFLKVLSRHTEEFVDWALRGGEWEKVVKKLINELEKTKKLSNYF